MEVTGPVDQQTAARVEVAVTTVEAEGVADEALVEQTTVLEEATPASNAVSQAILRTSAQIHRKFILVLCTVV